jgi:hypothetical protein
MKKIMKIALVVVVAITVIGIIAIVYANTNSTLPAPKIGKRPSEYGIMLEYFAGPVTLPYREWYTPEQLGITLREIMNEGNATGCYDITIVDETKALPWMKEYKADPPFGLKYQDEIYQIWTLHVTPGLPEHLKNAQPIIGGLMGAGWVLTGILFFKLREKE